MPMIGRRVTEGTVAPNMALVKMKNFCKKVRTGTKSSSHEYKQPKPASELARNFSNRIRRGTMSSKSELKLPRAGIETT